MTSPRNGNRSTLSVTSVAALTGLAGAPAFAQVRTTSSPVHYGEICTNGIVCGSSDRSLLDFISVAVDCKGLAHIAYGGNTKAQEAADETFVHVARQVGGTALAPPAPCALR